ncbi:hypothetical protein [Streptacidiphilus jiangxiensis]|uniref:Uncharacterized protein n=1 Tax=Streptacidiphilus jiangxiensis TaxID=235985 RepID=A0A1H8B442_STRJI|nr:hypothetical protein [Streptacidiphilus jiangxiensis]SEM77671.1 hypothetical protein SAMN05414137_1576 [Streptacidiphilus jiangxiensis]
MSADYYVYAVSANLAEKWHSYQSVERVYARISAIDWDDPEQQSEALRLMQHAQDERESVAPDMESVMFSETERIWLGDSTMWKFRPDPGEFGRAPGAVLFMRKLDSAPAVTPQLTATLLDYLNVRAEAHTRTYWEPETIEANWAGSFDALRRIRLRGGGRRIQHRSRAVTLNRRAMKQFLTRNQGKYLIYFAE